MSANLLIGGYPINTFAQRYVDANQKKHGLSNIYWGGGDGDQLSLARVTWNKQDAFMKCDIAAYGTNLSELDMPEIDAFEALKEAKEKLKGVYATGRQNAMDPLHQFDFSESNGNKYFCHLYGYINGKTLEDHIRKHTVSQAYIIASEILPEVIKGLIYLYNAGIIHGDLFPKNIMIQKNFLGRITGVKIIDFDSASIFDKEQGWRPIDPINEAYLSSNPPQQYASCKQLKNEITEFLNIFVTLNERENPYDPNYVVTEQVVLDYLKEFQENENYAKLELGNVKAAIPAIRYLLKVYYTLMRDPFTCSSPIRALKGLPPRISTPSRPVSPIV
ncbi:hypothetical protein BDF22DRAFT_772864 [Syncephalis plumigaleata]|nr:hypothetical protein BDF22DRAFT_772864 [Syncephalis plumigaleata]